MKQTIWAVFWGILLSSSYADLMWYYGDTTVEILQNQTGQSSGGSGLQVSWQDTTLRVYNPDSSFGLDTELSIQQNRPTLEVFNDVLISFDDMFGSGIGQIGDSAAFQINSATLWLYAEQAETESFTLTLAGLAVQNAGWSEENATFNTRDGSNSWSGGTFSDSLYGAYGSYTTIVQSAGAWIGIDITLALKAYQSQLISGIALIAPSEVTSVIRNLYAFSNEYKTDTELRPGVFVNLTAIPEPATGGFIVLGSLLCWIAGRRRKPLAVAVALTCSGVVQASQNVWISNDQSTANPDRTDVDHDIATTWKEAQIDPDETSRQTCGERDEIGVISPRTIPPLQSVVLFSFNDLFTPYAGGLPRSIVVDQASLWLYITQAVGTQDVALCAINTQDRDWDDTEATALWKNEYSWSRGTLKQSIGREYGRFRAPAKTGWFQLPVDLSAALTDYRAGLIGGLALRSLTESGNQLCNFYFLSTHSLDTSKHPALWVQYHPQPGAPAVMEQWIELNPETGQLEAYIYSPESDAVSLAGADAEYSFGGNWKCAIPLSSKPGTSINTFLLQGIHAAETQTVTQITHSEFMDIEAVDQAVRISWYGSADQWYHVLQADNLLQADWTDCAEAPLTPGNGNQQSHTITPTRQRGFYRLLSHQFSWNE